MYHRQNILFSIIILSLPPILCENNDGELNVDLILREDLMPTALFLAAEEPEQRNAEAELESSVNGSFNIALMTMDFHRRMMNEYQCRNFLAEKILDEMDAPRLRNRLGKPFSSPHELNTKLMTDKLRNNFVGEVDSAAYKDWLGKIATLEDIYRHYNSSTDNSKRRFDQYVTFPDYEGGDVTGYAIPMPAPPPPPQPVHQVGYDYNAQPSHQEVEKHHYEEPVERHSHALTFSDLFEISLTGLAFLSFGMFILQVIMCISMHKETIPVPMQVIDTQGDTINTQFRVKRSLFIDQSALNQLSKFAILTMKSSEKEVCLKNYICAGNKFAKGLTDGNQFWLPLWNVGISWLHKDSALGMLRAAALGLAGADCEALFESTTC